MAELLLLWSRRSLLLSMRPLLLLLLLYHPLPYSTPPPHRPLPPRCREVKLLRELHHPNIVRLFDVFSDWPRKLMFLVFELGTWVRVGERVSSFCVHMRSNTKRQGKGREGGACFGVCVPEGGMVVVGGCLLLLRTCRGMPSDPSVLVPLHTLSHSAETDLNQVIRDRTVVFKDSQVRWWMVGAWCVVSIPPPLIATVAMRP